MPVLIKNKIANSFSTIEWILCDAKEIGVYCNA